MKNLVLVLFSVIFGLLMIDCKNNESNTYQLSNDAKNKFDLRIGEDAENKEIVINNRDIRKIHFQLDAFGDPNILITFTGDGEKKFLKITTEYAGEKIYIYFYDELFISATIRGPITGIVKLNIDFEEVKILLKKNAFNSKDSAKIQNWAEGYWAIQSLNLDDNEIIIEWKERNAE